MASLYLHIPFCEKKCIYCDFYSIENISPMRDFHEALLHEIASYADLGRGESFETVFFGGGTPSLLSPEELDRILSHLRKHYTITPDAEITLETNPGTVSREKLQAYRALGVNRLSIGVQSFHGPDLQFLGRIHDSAQAVQCVTLAREAGFTNISLDLIYALPDQSQEGWSDTLERALALQPEHISAYGLIVEDGTPLARLVEARLVSPKPANDEAEFYQFTMEFMEQHGFDHYEVSNYARPGYRSQHNYNYWRHVNYLGFGPSAHSFWQKNGEARRWFNIANLSHYCAAVGESKRPLLMDELLTARQLLTERIFLGLRSDGLRLDALKADFDFDLLNERREMVEEFRADGRIVIERDTLRLTTAGYLLCDEICVRLIP